MTTPVGNRFPVDWILRVEVIRGPGSVIYGGAAELAVINIVLKDAEELSGVQISAVYGVMPKDEGFEKAQSGIDRGAFSLSAGEVFDETSHSPVIFMSVKDKARQRSTKMFTVINMG